MSPHPRPLGIVVLYNISREMIKGDPRDLIAEQGVIACAQAVSEALLARGYQVAPVPLSGDVETTLAPYPPTRWTIFNLAEGLAGRLFEEARIAWALEAMGYCITGSSGDAIAKSVNKAQAKRLLASHGVNTPAWWVISHPDEVHNLVDRSPFPLIVKPIAEDASIGVGPDAVVHSETALRERVAYIADHYRQAALAEAFIEGREFNVSVWGEPPQVLPLAEIDFSAFSDPYHRIVSYAAKWEESSLEYLSTPVVCPAPADAALAQRIEALAVHAWKAIGCRGYARADMRVSIEGIPYVVEVNCNPDLSPDAGFCRAAQAAGYSYEDMVVRIVEISRRHLDDQDRYSLGDRWPIHFGHLDQGRYLQPYGN